jgi:hypothetical protein
MASRFSPFNILGRHWKGLSDHRNYRGGRPDWPTRIALVVIPIAAGSATYWRNVDISKDVANLIAAGALLAALMMSLFVQLASWRSRLDDRAFTHLESEAPTRRAVDEASAHSLVGGITSIVAATVVVAAGILGPNRFVAGLTCVLAVYLGLLILVIFHMAWVAYWSLTDDDIRREDDRLLKPIAPKATIKLAELEPQTKPNSPAKRTSHEARRRHQES